MEAALTGLTRVDGSESNVYNVQTVFARLSRYLIVVALAGSIGLHWALLQVVAWTGMVVSYSQDGTITQAVAKTFDGQHPCKLCRQIAKEQQTEKKAECKVELAKLEFSYAATGFIFTPPTGFWEMSAPQPDARLLIQPPQVPPPRCLLG